MAHRKKAEQTPKDQPRKTYFRRTSEGFKLIGFSYRPEMPDVEKQKAVQALKEALAILEAELKGGSGK